MFETLARSKTTALHLDSDFSSGEIVPMLAAALPSSQLVKLFMIDVKLTNEHVPALAAAVGKSKLREIHFSTNNISDASFSTIMDAVDAHAILCGMGWKNPWSPAFDARFELSKSRWRVRICMHIPYESLLVGRTDTAIAAFLKKDGDNAIVTRVLRYLL